MKPMSNNERQKKRMEKLKSNGEYEDYKKKRAEQRRLSRKKAKDWMTAAQKEQHKVKRKLEQRLHRQRKKEHQIISTSVVTSPAFKSKASEGKAVQLVSKVLPKSPRKQKAVVKISYKTVPW